jgi:SNF2 family DNA or RNA helicase
MGGFNNKQIIEFINTDELNQKFYSIAHRVKLEDVVSLPPEQDITIRVNLCEKAKKIYDDLEKKFVAEYADDLDKAELDANGLPILPKLSVDNALVKMLRLAQIASGDMPLDNGDRKPVDSAKIDAVVDIVSDMPETENVVVFARFRSEMARLEEKLKKIGRKVGEISGSINELRKWENGEINTIVVQIQAGCEGIDTLKTARYCFYLSKGFSLGMYRQSRRRLKRPGQTRSVIFYHIEAKGTIDVRIAKAIERKQDIVRSVLGMIRSKE